MPGSTTAQDESTSLVGSACNRIKEASIADWVTMGVFCLRAMDGSWSEHAVSTLAQVVGVGAVATAVDYLKPGEDLSWRKLGNSAWSKVKAAAIGSGVGGAFALSSWGVLGTAAPIGAEATNAWVTDWLSSSTQTLIELETYDFYRNSAWIASFFPSLQAVYTKMRKEGARFDRGCTTEFAKDVGKLIGFALARTVLAAVANGGMNWALKHGHSDRPIKYNTERTSPATDPVRQESQGKWQSKNTLNGVKSCTLSKEENWPSGHSSTTMLGAVEAENIVMTGLWAVPGLMTMVGRVLADCHTPSAVIAGMLLAGLSVEAADVIVDRLIHKCVAPAHQDELRDGLVKNSGMAEVNADMLQAMEGGEIDASKLAPAQREKLAKLRADQDAALAATSEL